MQEHSLFSTSAPAFIVCRLFDDGHSDHCEVMSHCSFDLSFSNNESWTVKKAEHRSIDTFELWCWRRLLRVLWTVRRSNQSILKEISPGISLEGMVLKLKLQDFGHLM